MTACLDAQTAGGIRAAVALLLAVGLLGCRAGGTDSAPSPPGPVPGETPEKWCLTSAAFADSTEIPVNHTCDGQNVSPPLAWGEPPPGTAEFALICNDPDAPSGNWVHWLLYGIPPGQRRLTEAVPNSETLPDLGGAKQGLNDSGRVGYTGPCPPAGPAHHYHFRLYALDAATDLPPGATEAALRNATAGHVLAHSEVVGLYSR
jgi:Raf kinase inhibitor-like YbhB/YbcL family protein